MINRQALENGNIKYESYTPATVGDEIEVPMNAWGSTVGRFRIVSMEASGPRYVVEAERIA